MTAPPPGNLARAVLIAEGYKPGGGEEPVALALCGVLCDLFALAEHYHIDLDAHYGTALAQLPNRSHQPSTPADPAPGGGGSGGVFTEHGVTPRC